MKKYLIVWFTKKLPHFGVTARKLSKKIVVARMNGMVMKDRIHITFLTGHEILWFVMYEYLMYIWLVITFLFQKPMEISSLMPGLWNQQCYECEGTTV